MSKGRIRLEGLEPEKLVSFLALLGIMRTLRLARPESDVRCIWEGVDSRPELEVPPETSVSDVLALITKGTRMHASAMEFENRKDVDFSALEFRTLLSEAIVGVDVLRLDACSALASDAIVDTRKNRVRATPFCLMFGQGHQHFLARWQEAPRVSEVAFQRELEAALLHPWRYDAEGLTFRWDPSEDRRYALRGTNPSDERTPTSDAANRLAAIGLMSLPVFPDRHNVLAAGVTRRRGLLEFSWPIWRVPLTEPAMIALLRHPYIANGRGRPPAGLLRVYRAERRSVGKFMSVTPGVPRDEPIP